MAEITTAEEIRDRTQTGPLLRFIIGWGALERELGREPSLDEYCDWRPLSPSMAQKYERLFREYFPEEATPSRFGRILWEKPCCTRCGGRLEVPEDLPERLRSEVEELRRERGGSGVDTFLLGLKAGMEAGLSPRDAKAISLHLANEGPACPCGTSLPVDGDTASTCPECRSLRLIWD
jgi:hypothetical protein